jgi:hypothetical protein
LNADDRVLEQFAWHKTWLVFLKISYGSKDVGTTIHPLDRQISTHKLHDEVELIGSLKGISKTN